MDDHRELNDYLNAHPDVRKDWAANPQGFVKGAQQFSTSGNAAGVPANPAGRTSTNGSNSGSNSTGSPTGTTNPAPTHEPKTK